MSTIYIAGPMTGYPEFNFPAFDKARDSLNAQGWVVLSPADLDREAGYGPDSDKTEPLKEVIKRDLSAIQSVDAMFMLDGWQSSKGARAEHALAVWLGLAIYYQSDGGDVPKVHKLTSAQVLRTVQNV